MCENTEPSSGLLIEIGLEMRRRGRSELEDTVQVILNAPAPAFEHQQELSHERGRGLRVGRITGELAAEEHLVA